MNKEGTVDDFSVQWAAYYDNSGFFASEELLRDVLEPLVNLDDLKGQAIAEVGCGNGRYIGLFAKFAEKVYGIEPGDGAENARDHTKDLDNVEVVRASIYEVPEIDTLDHAFSLGVIHHLPDPKGALVKMREMTRSGGKVTIWVYGYEGNELYLQTFGRARKLTKKLPHTALHALSTALVPPLRGYIKLSERLSALPMSDYMQSVLAPLTNSTLRVNIYDQLNPKIAHYWKRHEVKSLMESAGLVDVNLHHRHGYSWTATGIVP